jgi:hypothetical protein
LPDQNREYIVNKQTVIWSVLSAAVMVSGCVSRSPVFDQNFGASMKTLQAQQVRNPNAPVANRDKLPDGIDGRAARESMERYATSFSEPPPPVNVFSIGVGTPSGGSR